MVEIESEKTTAEITAEENGVLLVVDVAEGEEMPPGTRLGVISDPDEHPEEASSWSATDESTPAVKRDGAGASTTPPTSMDAVDRWSAPDRVPAALGARFLDSIVNGVMTPTKTLVNQTRDALDRS